LELGAAGVAEYVAMKPPLRIPIQCPKCGPVIDDDKPCEICLRNRITISVRGIDADIYHADSMACDAFVSGVQQGLLLAHALREQPAVTFSPSLAVLTP